MYTTIHIFNFILPLLYASGFGIYLYDFFFNVKKLDHFKRLILFLCIFLHIIYIIIRTFIFNHPPITNVFEIFTVLAFAISFSYFILELVTDVRGTGPFIIIFSLIFQLISSFFIKDLIEVREVLRSNLLGIHVFHALLGYSGITISAVYGFLYLTLYKDIKNNKFGLVFNRLPNLEILEKLSYYSAVIGFIALSVAIIIGVLWLPIAFPKFSYTDPKLIATFVVWLMYGIGIFAKISGRWIGRRIVILSIVGFIIAIISTITTNFLAKSFHSFY